MMAGCTEQDTKGPDLNYLLDMEIWSLSFEHNQELLRQRDIKAAELHLLQEKAAVDLWKNDLANFLTELDVRFIHSFFHSEYFYSTSSSPLLLRGTPNYSIDTVSELRCRSATGNYE